MKIILIVITLIAFQICTAAVADSNRNGSITGKYLDNYNLTIELVQKGEKISGSMFGLGVSGGYITIQGVKINDVITISLNPEYGSHGKGELKISDGGTILTGRVRRAGYPASWSAWELSKLGPGGEIVKNPAHSELARQSAENKRLDEIIPVASGSGFAVSSDGHVVTNNHVIDGCTYVKIHHRGTVIQSTILYRDLINDLAVIKGDFVPSKIFKISRRNPGLLQDIFVAGYPFGIQLSSSVKVTKGIVSSLSGIGNNVSNLQIDAALQPGNSGGPIFDNRGNVIGVTVAKLDLKKTVKDWGVVPENTNFGIKSNVVVNLLESNGIKIQEANQSSLSNPELGEILSGATYHLSCWMTRAKAREMATSKVMFRDLTEQ